MRERANFFPRIAMTYPHTSFLLGGWVARILSASLLFRGVVAVLLSVDNKRLVHETTWRLRFCAWFDHSWFELSSTRQEDSSSLVVCNELHSVIRSYSAPDHAFPRVLVKILNGYCFGRPCDRVRSSQFTGSVGASLPLILHSAPASHTVRTMATDRGRDSRMR